MINRPYFGDEHCEKIIKCEADFDEKWNTKISEFINRTGSENLLKNISPEYRQKINHLVK
jgi:dissimilatory sulfite reductase (desulfoviridin) alpha/beta subunit